MNEQMILGLMLTLALSGCFDGSGGSSAGSSTGTGSGNIASVPPVADTTVPLVLTGTPPSSATVGTVLTYQPTVTSSNGAVTFSVTGLPAWASLDSATGTLSGTPSTSDVGITGDITLTATDGTSTGSVGPFVIRVLADAPPAPAATPPVISGTPSTTATTGQAYAFQPQASDVAGNALTFAITNRPAWATFSTATGRLSGAPATAQAGVYSGIVIQATDGTLSAALPTFSITVTAASVDTPVISGSPANSVIAGQAYGFLPTASDPAGKALDFTIVQAPAWATFNAATGKLSGTPTAAQAGAYPNIVISASNGTASASLVAFTVTVEAPVTTDTPVISGTPTTAVTAGQSYRFTPTAIDPAGKALTFSISNKPVWTTFSTTTGALSGTPTTTQTGSYPSVGISVTNGTTSATLAAFGITVAAPAPVVTPPPVVTAPVVTPPPTTNGSATLSWTAPTVNTDGTPLTNLAGYQINYGSSATSMPRTLQGTDPTATSATITGLSSGTWYFEVVAINAVGLQSSTSGVVSKTL